MHVFPASRLAVAGLGLVLSLHTAGAQSAATGHHPTAPRGTKAPGGPAVAPRKISLGPRPEYIVNNMEDGELKTRLSGCLEMEHRKHAWSIGHRGGGPLFIPEETRESIVAGTRMGAGIEECDVGVTADRQLVCRHAQCDLHTTTNIVATPLGAKCSEPFAPADPATGAPASAKCCVNDVTLAEFKSLCGKMDGFNASATTAADFLSGTPDWRTNMYASECGTVLSHREYLELVKGLGLDFTSELKAPETGLPEGYTYDMYRRQLIAEYRAAGIPASRTYPQSFVYDDVLFWLANETGSGARADDNYAQNAILLIEEGDTPETYPAAVARLPEYKAAGVPIIAPPIGYLLEATGNGTGFRPSEYAARAMELGLDIITWSLDRSPPVKRAVVGTDGEDAYYYSHFKTAMHRDGDIYRMLHALHTQVGIKGIFSDWSATASLYANCFDPATRAGPAA